MNHIYICVRVKGYECQRFVGIILEFLLNHKAHGEIVSLVDAVSLYEPVHFRSQSNGLYNGCHQHLKEFIRFPLVIRVLFFQIFFYRSKVDSLADECFVVCSVGIEIRYNGMKCVKVS